MLVGAGPRTYSFNKPELVEVPPGTKCDVEVVAEPLTVLVLYISGRNLGNGRLIVVFDGDESHAISLQGADPRYHQLPPVGYKYTVRLNIPKDEEPSKLMLMVEAEKVQQNLNVRRMETEPVEIIPSSEIPTYVTVHAPEQYRIGLLMDCHLRETAGRMDPRVLKNLRNVIFFSDEDFLTR
ncbi:unnamed protein product [Heligmosomoides polygyrus]|uniref:DUF4384 domain-containing protein n=1 Tax=Heligmosomoides polygyrus TaxID=6339 RepID=A0A183GEV3_HELPZ|nr:unnamed protein product [Heligmosomoides polygyrus]